MGTIAIDFGTSRTKLAYRMPGESRAELLRFQGEQDRAYVPSLFHLPRGSDAVLFGERAEEQLEADPFGLVATPLKRQLRASKIRAPGRTEPPGRLLEVMLAELRDKAGREVAAFGGELPAAAVLTVPAGPWEAERQLLETSARAVGFETVTFIEEPVAAAAAWLTETGSAAASLVVLDCGGGTVDWAWLRADDGRLRLVSTCPPGGIAGLGGYDVDLGLLELAEQELLDGGVDAAELAGLRPRLLVQLRRLKEGIARSREPRPVRIGAASVTLGREVVVDVARARFVSRAIEGLLDYLNHVRAEVEEGALMPPVLPVGGSAGLPGLRTILAATGIDVVGWDRAEYAPALGALIAAETAREPYRTNSRPTGPAKPSVLVVDARGRGDFAGLREAVRAASPGAVIRVRPGLYVGDVAIDKPLEIIGDGPRDTIIVRGSGERLLSVTAASGQIAGLTLRHSSGEAIAILHGRVTIADCDISAAVGIRIADEADPLLRLNSIHEGDWGIVVCRGGRGTIEGNIICGHRQAQITVETEAAPTIRRNRVHDGRSTGLFISNRGHGIVERNEIQGHIGPQVIIRTGSDPILCNNRIRDGKSIGVFCNSEGRGTLEINEITGHAQAQLLVTTGADPVVRRNRIHDGQSAGLAIAEGGCGTYADNDITGNLQNVSVSADSRPVMQ